MTASAEEKRLLLLLRETRTLNELRAAKLELDLQSSLARLQRLGCAHIVKDKWVLTEKGMDLLP